MPQRKSVWIRLTVKWGGWETLKLASLAIEVLTRVCTTASSLDRCGLTTCWIPETSRCSFVQKFGATPKANSDVFATPSGQEPCLQKGSKRAECRQIQRYCHCGLQYFSWAAASGLLPEDKQCMTRGGSNSYNKRSEFRLPPETTDTTEDCELCGCSRGSVA